MIPPEKRRFGKHSSKSLAEIVSRTLDPLVARQGFSESSLLMKWEAIVGARIAGVCEPIRLQWPPRAKNRTPEKTSEPATLVLRVEPGFGLDIQHMSGAIMNRVNAHLGWRCVAKIAIRQEQLRREAQRPQRIVPIAPEARARAAIATQGVEDEALRAALIRMGEQAFGRASDVKPD